MNIRYIVKTTIGKPLYIVGKPSAVNKKGVFVSRYELTDDLDEASKCPNRQTADSLLFDYQQANPDSTKTFEIAKVEVIYRMLEEVDDG